MSRWLFVWMTAFVFAWLPGCADVPMPQLVELHDVAPREIELGSRLELAGAGFPAGKDAFVHLRGTLFRPGAEPIERVDVEATGLAVGSHHIEVAITRPLADALTNVGPLATHTTFRGTIEAGFAPTSPSLPPIAATLGNVTLDIHATDRTGTQLEALTKRALLLLKFAGVQIEEHAGLSGGIRITHVLSGSSAERANLLAGDVVLSSNGVRVTHPSDLAISDGLDSVEWVIRRDGREAPRKLNVRGYESSWLAGKEWAFMLVLIALITLVSLFVMKPRVWLHAENASQSLAFGPTDIAVVVATAIVPVLGNGWNVHGDLIILSTTLTLSAVALAWQRRTPFARNIRHVGRALMRTIALVTSFGLVTLSTGAVRFEELSRVQAGAPTRWLMFGSVGIALSSFVAAVFSIALADSPTRRSSRLFLWLVSAAWILIFAGGWQLPGQAPVHPSSPALAFGALLFVGKVWIAHSVSRSVSVQVRRTLERTSVWRQVFFCVALPLGLVCLERASFQTDTTRNFISLVLSSFVVASLVCVLIHRALGKTAPIQRMSPLL